MKALNQMRMMVIVGAMIIVALVVFSAASSVVHKSHTMNKRTEIIEVINNQ
jgi:hypothetical protein